MLDDRVLKAGGFKGGMYPKVPKYSPLLPKAELPFQVP